MRHAPGFAKSVIGRQIHSPLDLERRFGLIGGDIFHGKMGLDQLFSARPMIGAADYRMPLKGLYLCGSGAHPGGGVTGAPGHNAAQAVLADRRFWKRRPLKPLEGIKVLDLSRVLAGPWCTQLLADLGAEVIKIERPGSGDDTRHWGPPWHGEGDRARRRLFPQRQSRQEIGGDRFRRARRRGAGPQAGRQTPTSSSRISRSAGSRSSGSTRRRLRAANPRLVYASITGFGQDGPYADRAGYDYIIQGMGGLMSITGLPDGEPGGGPMRVGRGGRRPVHRPVHLRRDPRRALSRARRAARARTSTWRCSTRSWRCSPTRRRTRWFRARTRRARAIPTPISCLTSRSTPPISRSSSPSATTGSSRGWRRFAGIPNGPATSASRPTARALRTARRWCGWSARQFATKPAGEWLEQLEAAGIPAGPINRISAGAGRRPGAASADGANDRRHAAGRLARPDRRERADSRPAAARPGRAYDRGSRRPRARAERDRPAQVRRESSASCPCRPCSRLRPAGRAGSGSRFRSAPAPRRPCRRAAN